MVCREGGWAGTQREAPGLNWTPSLFHSWVLIDIFQSLNVGGKIILKGKVFSAVKICCGRFLTLKVELIFLLLPP